jgi:putative toxin-antitoxin system antitoxin component (TIGR02293 family)
MTASTSEAPARGRNKPAKRQKLVFRRANSGAGAKGTQQRPRRAKETAAALLEYKPEAGVRAYVKRVWQANPLQVVALERAGVSAAFIKDLSAYMGVRHTRMFDALGLPKATAERKVVSRAPIKGSSGHAAVAMAKLLGIAEDILANSTAPDAANFETAKWLGQWLQRPQPSLGGLAPTDLLGTPTGFEIVARLLRAIESGSYQ